MSVVTLVRTVGSKKVPPTARRACRRCHLGTILTASAMCGSTFSTIAGGTVRANKL
jgi:hypothetical protein